MTPNLVLALHLAVDVALIGQVVIAQRYRRRLHAAQDRLNSTLAQLEREEQRSASLASDLDHVQHRLRDANGVIRSLEETCANTSRLLTDAQGTIGTLEMHAVDLETQLAASQQAVADERAVNDVFANRIDEDGQHIDALKQSVADLEARLRLPEPTPADLVLLDAASRPERLQDAPVAVPDGCRVETVLHRPQTVLRGPKGKFMKVVVGTQGERSAAEEFTVGRDRKEGWA